MPDVEVVDTPKGPQGEKIKSTYVMPDGETLWYSIETDGYYIYRGEFTPWMHQYEPYIPYRNPEDPKEYSFGCFKHMEELCKVPEPIPNPETELGKRVGVVESQVTEVQVAMTEVFELVLPTDTPTA